MCLTAPAAVVLPRTTIHQSPPGPRPPPMHHRSTPHLCQSTASWRADRSYKMCFIVCATARQRSAATDNVVVRHDETTDMARQDLTSHSAKISLAGTFSNVVSSLCHVLVLVYLSAFHLVHCISTTTYAVALVASWMGPSSHSL